MRASGLWAGVLMLGWLGGAEAHHPGSHASREKNGQVRIDIAAATTDSCLAVGTVRNVAPPRVSAAPASAPVTVQLQRSTGSAPCRTTPTVVRAERRLEIAAGVQQLHLFILAPEGTILSTERVPLQ